MSSKVEVWMALPTANIPQCAECVERWSSLGYRTAVFVDEPCELRCDFLFVNNTPWPGYYTAMNRLTQEIMQRFDTEIVVAIGDDMYPHPTRPAGEIGAEFIEHFPTSFGIMQPLGDKWPPTLDEICGSPWLGRDFIRRMNGGTGPWHGEYFHFFGDQELRDVSLSMDVLWQRQDVKQYHEHWSRGGSGIGARTRRTRVGRKRPAYMKKAQNKWTADKSLYEARKAEGFPGHEPTALVL